MGVVNYCIPDFATTLPKYLKVPFASLFSNVKSPSVTDREWSQKVYFKKSNNPSPFVRKTTVSINVLTLAENYVWFARKISLNARRQEKTRVHLLYNGSMEINIFIFTPTNSPCVFVFHSESIEIGRPYLETPIDFSYKCLLFVGPPMVCFPQKFGQHMFFLGSLCKPPCFSAALWNIHTQIWQLDAKRYEFEFDLLMKSVFCRP